jgi:hypothetical protein
LLLPFLLLPFLLLLASLVLDERGTGTAFDMAGLDAGVGVPCAGF